MHVRIIILFITLLVNVACTKTPPEQAILATIASIQTAIETKKTNVVLEYLGEDFIGNERINKQDIKRLLLVHYLRHNNINVVITKMSVDINPNIPFRAQSKGVVLLTGAQSIFPQDGRVYNVTLQWELREGDWLLIRLAWE